MPSSSINITLIGDSTIDNRLWVEGPRKNHLFTQLGINHESSEQRIKEYQSDYLKPQLSIIENLRVQLPETYEVHDATNDGFTSDDILNGAYRDKEFGEAVYSLYPHEFFSPLDEHATNIENSEYIVLSAGNNDLREFLSKCTQQPEDTRAQYIQDNLPLIFKNWAQNYIEIIQRVRKLNPNARIIVLTQYYPSAKQNDHRTYELIREIGQALKIGTEKSDPMDVIHYIMKQSFNGIIKNLEDDPNLIIADVASSLNPLDSNNYTWQIEPSGQGGKKIAKMMHYLITADVDAGYAYRFGPEFLEDDIIRNSIVGTEIQTEWSPLHPQEIDNAEQIYKASKPIDYDWSLVLKILAGVAIAAAAVLALWWLAGPIGAVAGTLAIGALAGYTAYRFFAPEVNKPVAIIPVVNDDWGFANPLALS